MSPFTFDKDVGCQENIVLLLAQIEKGDPQLGRLQKEHLSKMLPLREGMERTAARQLFNHAIATALDAVEVKEGRSGAVLPDAS